MGLSLSLLLFAVSTVTRKHSSRILPLSSQTGIRTNPLTSYFHVWN